MYHRNNALLEISEHVIGKGIVKVVWNDKRSRSQPEWTRTTDALERPDLRHWPIVGRYHQGRACEDAVENAFGISLDLFDVAALFGLARVIFGRYLR